MVRLCLRHLDTRDSMKFWTLPRIKRALAITLPTIGVVVTLAPTSHAQQTDMRPIAQQTCSIYTEALSGIAVPAANTETTFRIPPETNMQLARDVITQTIDAETNPEMRQALIDATSRYMRTGRPNDLTREIPALLERCTDIQLASYAQPSNIRSARPRSQLPLNNRDQTRPASAAPRQNKTYTPPPPMGQSTLRR